MSYEAVRWALYDAPMLVMTSGKPDIAARMVLIVRAERAGKDGRGTYAGHPDIVQATGYDVRTIQRAERRLEEAGLMVRRGMSHLGTPRWDLDLSIKADRESFAAERIDRRRKMTAERVRRHRAQQKSESEAPESADSIETDVSIDEPVTTPTALRNAVQERYVTPFNDGCNGTHATQTTNEPPVEPPVEPPLGARRPQTPGDPPPFGRGTEMNGSLAVALTPAQDQQGESLPHARARAPVVEIRPGASLERPHWMPPPRSPAAELAVAEARLAIAAARSRKGVS